MHVAGVLPDQAAVGGESRFVLSLSGHIASLVKRCGDEVSAPDALGGGKPTLASAPGTYVVAE